MPYRRHVSSGSCKLLEFIALLLAFTALLVVVITGGAFWLNKDMQALIWGGAVIGSLGTALVILLKTIDRICK